MAYITGLIDTCNSIYVVCKHSENILFYLFSQIYVNILIYSKCIRVKPEGNMRQKLNYSTIWVGNVPMSFYGSGKPYHAFFLGIFTNTPERKSDAINGRSDDLCSA